MRGRSGRREGEEWEVRGGGERGKSRQGPGRNGGSPSAPPPLPSSPPPTFPICPPTTPHPKEMKI